MLRVRAQANMHTRLHSLLRWTIVFLLLVLVVLCLGRHGEDTDKELGGGSSVVSSYSGWIINTRCCSHGVNLTSGTPGCCAWAAGRSCRQQKNLVKQNCYCRKENDLAVFGSPHPQLPVLHTLSRHTPSATAPLDLHPPSPPTANSSIRALLPSRDPLSSNQTQCCVHQ